MEKNEICPTKILFQAYKADNEAVRWVEHRHQYSICGFKLHLRSPRRYLFMLTLRNALEVTQTFFFDLCRNLWPLT